MSVWAGRCVCCCKGCGVKRGSCVGLRRGEGEGRFGAGRSSDVMRAGRQPGTNWLPTKVSR